MTTTTDASARFDVRYWMLTAIVNRRGDGTLWDAATDAERAEFGDCETMERMARDVTWLIRSLLGKEKS